MSYAKDCLIVSDKKGSFEDEDHPRTRIIRGRGWNASFIIASILNSQYLSPHIIGSSLIMIEFFYPQVCGKSKTKILKTNKLFSQIHIVRVFAVRFRSILS